MTTEVRATIVDSSVLLDVFHGDRTWAAWSEGALSAAADEGPLLINPVIFGELAPSFATIEELHATLAEAEIVRQHVPWPAAFLAGKAFVEYRRRGGARHSPLPDFFIGAHAAVVGLALLTRDARRYRDYFPTVEVIAPA